MLRRRVTVLIRCHLRQGLKNRKYNTESGIVKSPYPDISLPNIPLQKYVFQNANKWPNHTAIECGVSGKKYTYSQLIANSKRLGTSFKKYGLKKGDIVSFFLPNIPEFPVAYFGALEARLCVTSMNPACTKDEIIHQLKDCKAEWIICHPSYLPVVLQVSNVIKNLKIICTNDLNGRSPRVPNNTILFEEMIDSSVEISDSSQDVDMSDLALIAYSSGTTGLPKGTCLTHQSFGVNVEQISSSNCSKMFETHGADQCVVPAILPFFHNYGNIMLHYSLRFGAKSISLPKFDPKRFLMTLKNNNNLNLYLVPPIVFFLGNSCDVTSKHLSHVDSITTSAGPCSASDIEKVKHKSNGPILISQAYGLTEASAALTIYQASGSDKDNYSTIGHPVSNTSAKVISLDDGQTLSHSQPGELLFKGPQVMKGYLNNEKATAETIDADGWLHTGDLGYFDQDGLFYITERLKELIKVKGFQVAPAELEQVLRQHPEVLEAGVVGAPSETSGEVPVAFIQTVPGSNTSEEEIKRFLASRVTKYKHLSSVRFLDTLPKTASGKILRRQLKTMI